MADFTAKDVQAPAPGHRRRDDGRQEGARGERRRLRGRRASGCARRAWPRPASRTDRDNTQGAVAVSPTRATSPRIVELKCETDFVAKSDQFTSLVQELAALGRRQGRGRRRPRRPTPSTTSRSPSRRTSSWARSSASRRADGNVLDTYLHLQDGRGVNGVLVELAGGTPGARPRHRRAHRLHQARRTSAATRCPRPRSPRSGRRSRPSPGPRASPRRRSDKIVEGRLTGWFKERVLLEQKFVKDEKQTITAAARRRRRSSASPRSSIGG